MLNAVKRSVNDYNNKSVWNSLVKRAMKCNYSWSASADIYISLYNDIL